MSTLPVLAVNQSWVALKRAYREGSSVEDNYWVATGSVSTCGHSWSGVSWLEGSDRESVSCDWVSPVVDTSDNVWLEHPVSCEPGSLTFSFCDDCGDGGCVAPWLWLWLWWFSICDCDCACDMVLAEWVQSATNTCIYISVIAPDCHLLVAKIVSRQNGSLEHKQARYGCLNTTL